VKKRQRILWITDPWNTLDHPRDTTLRLAQATTTLGIQQYWCDVKSIRLENHTVRLNAKSILSVGPERSQSSFEWGEMTAQSPKDFTSIHYRTDPPVDHAYLHPLQLLALGLTGNKTTEVINPLEVLLTRNEKTEAASLKDLMPPSLVSSQWEHLKTFGEAHGRTVLKPLHEAQSHGIELLDWDDHEGKENAQKLLKAATQDFQSPIILQKYLQEISDGETRLWFVDGKLLASVKKLPVSGDFRVDIDRGSLLAPTSLSKQDKSKATRIARHLKNRKIRLAAVDLIQGYITDFNFTSPGLIPQMESVLGENLSRRIMNAIAG
jgi:glutathione synthase